MVITVCAALTFGCATQQAGKTPQPDAQSAGASKSITDITVGMDADSVAVAIKGNRPLTYTSVKQPQPAAVVLYFPDTALARQMAVDTPANTTVSSVKAAAMAVEGKATRVEIALKQDAAYTVLREGNGLKIAFRTTGSEEVRDQAADTAAQDMPDREKDGKLADAAFQEEPPVIPPATRLRSVTATPSKQAVRLIIRADGIIKDFKSFTVQNPPRIVFDMPRIQSAFKGEQTVNVNSQWVKTVRHLGYPDRVRLVIDTQDAFLDAHAAAPVVNGLEIFVGANRSAVQALATQRAASVMTASGPAVNAKAPLAGEAAWVNRIDFSSETGGKSTLIIGTTQAVKYDLQKSSAKTLQLKLFNSRLPDYRKRALITTRFESAVDRITPFQTPTVKDQTVITIEMREAVPYRVEQLNDLLLVHFEASRIPPKPFEQAKLPAWKAVIDQAVPTPGPAPATTTSVPGAPSTGAPLAKLPPPIVPSAAVGTGTAPAPQVTSKYTGEKIALDFFDTDIKNVFRILKEVSGKNFAIDKNVKGRVTLTLEKPVPWDQVLELILKMNQLDYIYEGDIIRIATAKTIAAERKRRDAALAAERKALAVKKELEPLVTEFIPINYSNANSDIVPHLKKIKSGRGSLSVNSRTNLIIYTDTAENVAQAKELIKTLDRVTPQVIIEARIVEANTNFIRGMGIDWNLTGPDMSIGRDFLITPSAAVNLPVTSVANLGFDILDSSLGLVLSAQLTAAETKGQTKIISTPKVVTLDNKTATIKQGIRVPYLKLDDSGNTTTSFESVDLTLEVTPHVTPDQRVTLEINITKNDLGSIINGQQSFTTNEAQTELLINDGDTVVIGGIMKTDTTLSDVGVPGLDKIPMLGWLFKSNTRSEDKEELLIFITPRIVQLEQAQM